jgi:hypothetical protein
VRGVQSRLALPIGTGLMLVMLASPGCRREHGASGQQGKKAEQTPDAEAEQRLFEVRVGKERAQFYIAYGYDSALLGFAVSAGTGPARYFPLIASTDRHIPSVALEVFASKSEREMWVRSDWPGSEVLAYRLIGAETTQTPWGEMKPLEKPMPDSLSGGPSPFPAMPMDQVVKKATFKHE